MSEDKVDAWMPLWIGAYLADTMTLTTQQHGAYLLLLFAYWRNRGPLVDDDEDLAAITKATPSEWKKLRQKLARFFTIAEGHWSHTRADKELAKAGVLKAAAVSKARAGAEARWKKARKQCSGDAPSMPGAMLGQCPTPTPIGGKEPIGSSPPDGGGDGEVHEVAPERFAPSVYGSICGAIRRAGIGAVDPGFPAFRAAVDAGATSDEFVAFAREALDKDQPFKWLIGAVVGERKRAAQLAGQLHRGAMPNKQVAIETRNRAVADEWAQESTP